VGIAVIGSGASVIEMDVTEAGIWVGVMVFVGRGTGLVGCATGAKMLHASDTTRKIERNKKNFLMVESPFMLNPSL
jgi:hypothetical protein